MKIHLRVLLAVLALAAPFVAAAPAQAAPACYRTSCTNLDPQANGCSTADTRNLDEFTQSETGGQVLRVELRYSPACGAVWTRVTFLNNNWVGEHWRFGVIARWSEPVGGSPDWMRFVNRPTTEGQARWTRMHAFDSDWYAACLSDSTGSITGACTSPRH
jgi:hypothetical protein